MTDNRRLSDGSLLDKRIYTTAAWMGIVAMIVALAAVAFAGKWLSALLLAGFLIASITFVLLEERLPTLFNLLFVVAALLNAAGWVWELYGKIPGYDEITHLFTSFAVTLLLGYPVFRILPNGWPRDHRVFFFLVIASFGITLGALWEIFEWAILIPMINPIVDIVMDGMGGIIAAVAWILGLISDDDARDRQAKQR